MEPRRPIPSVTTKNSRSRTTAYRKTTKEPSENQEKETKLLGQQFAEKEKEYEEAVNDAEELANLVRTKCEAIQTLEKRPKNSLQA